MPFYWMNSVLMVLFILMSLLILFFYKKKELMNSLSYSTDKNESLLNFNFMW
uniref:ATP synthase F0 subunit 8 n=1 Tax=Pardosa pseudoannulata TaxID=330961 RepID=UPI002E793E89|nr:ATP synthase F0 subunit 8 [Pardosa pseudoannulata]WRI06647.1 ATP synthase F0 subunit 8 [Pardosa pseudoannulata]